MKLGDAKPLREFGRGFYDGPHATPPESSDGPIFLRLDNITPDGRLDLTDLRYISENDFPKWTRRVKPEAGDVVFSYEAALHRYVLIPEGFHGCLGRRLALMRPDRNLVDSRFLLYYFLSEPWQMVSTSAIINGATVDRFSLTRFRECLVRFPERAIQSRIAETLIAYDDAIENNRRRMGLLEKAARLLYEEWFVRLRFPGHEHTPITNGLPQGWKIVSLDEVKANIPNAITGGPFGSNLGIKDYVESGIPVIRGSNLSESGQFHALDFVFVTEEKADKLGVNCAKPGDIVVTQRGTLGQIATIPAIGYARYLLSQSQMKITVDESIARRAYVFNFLRSPASNANIKNLASSSGVPHINLTTFRNFKLLLPPLRIQKAFAQFVSPMENAIDLLTRQNVKLQSARNLLLPRLMSGEIEV